MDDIQTFISDKEDEVIQWLQDLNSGLMNAYQLPQRCSFRFRLYNEVNTFKLFEPEDYYLVLHWFYPLFKTYGPPGSYLMISISGSESEQKGIDYKGYLRRMLEKHCEVAGYNEPLPLGTLK